MIYDFGFRTLEYPEALSAVLYTIAKATIALAAIAIALSQCRKPFGWPGRLFLQLMNVRHASVTRWGMGHVAIGKDFTILDVGCGGGKTIERLAAAASSGTVFGVDHSPTSVAAARQLNAAAIAAGRVDVLQGSVSRLPFSNDTFDLVIAVETHYYWPQPIDDGREILRVLKPGGRLVVIAETYRGETFDKLLAIPMKLLRARYLTLREHQELFTAAGFADVAIHAERRKGWVCVVALKR